MGVFCQQMAGFCCRLLVARLGKASKGVLNTKPPTRVRGNALLKECWLKTPHWFNNLLLRWRVGQVAKRFVCAFGFFLSIAMQWVLASGGVPRQTAGNLVEVACCAFAKAQRIANFLQKC